MVAAGARWVRVAMSAPSATELISGRGEFRDEFSQRANRRGRRGIGKAAGHRQLVGPQDVPGPRRSQMVKRPAWAPGAMSFVEAVADVGDLVAVGAGDGD